MPQYTFAFPVSRNDSRTDFAVSDANREALAWVDRYPQWNSHAVLLTGPVSSGKTHLAHVWLEKADAVELNYQEASDPALWNRLTANDALLIEAADRMPEEALFHFLNAVCAANAHVLLTSQLAPSAWPVTLPDLRSRLNALPHITLEKPDDDLLALVLTKHFSDRQIHVESDVIRYIVPRIERSFAAAQAIVAALDKAALEEGRAVTLPLTRKILEIKQLS